MNRSCERPGCIGRAGVAYIIDPVKLVVNIFAPIPQDVSRMNVLCRRHADSLVVPKGWTIADSREKKQRLFSAPASPKLVNSESSIKPRRQTAIVTDIPIEFDAEEANDPQETKALPWTPKFDQNSDLDGKLRARGRLLGRAFGHVEQHPEQ